MAHPGRLTSLPNRTPLLDRLRQALSISLRNQTRTAVPFPDLDRFKEINDRPGHHAGDQLLQKVSARPRSVIRQADTVSLPGGDEFIVAFPEAHVLDGVWGGGRENTQCDQRRMHGCRSKIEHHAEHRHQGFPDHGADPVILLRLADKAMYEAKQPGSSLPLPSPRLAD